MHHLKLHAGNLSKNTHLQVRSVWKKCGNMFLHPINLLKTTSQTWLEVSFTCKFSRFVKFTMATGYFHWLFDFGTLHYRVTSIVLKQSISNHYTQVIVVSIVLYTHDWKCSWASGEIAVFNIIYDIIIYNSLYGLVKQCIPLPKNLIHSLLNFNQFNVWVCTEWKIMDEKITGKLFTHKHVWKDTAFTVITFNHKKYQTSK